MSDFLSPADGRNITKIETLWPLLMRAHNGSATEAAAAQLVILQRYRPAVYRYLLTCLNDEDAADELWQEFSLRFVRGDFRNADPAKGRFRDLVKTAIYNLMMDHHKKRKRTPVQLSPEAPEPEARDNHTTWESDQRFLDAWRNELLNRCWLALEKDEQKTQRPLHTVLRCRAVNPEMRSHQLAETLAKQLGKPISAEWVRKWMQIARNKFAAHLIYEVAGSLKEPTPNEVEQELMDLELYQYCKDMVDRWRTEGTIES